MNRWPVVAAVGTVLLSGCGFGSERHSGQAGAGDPLQQAEIATRGTDYDGVMDTRRLYERKWISGQVRAYFHAPGLSRYEYLTPPLRGIIKAKAKGFAWTYDPRQGRVVIVPGPLTEDVDRDELTRENYKTRIGPTTMVAGRQAKQVDVVPKHPGNSSRRFWVDSSTGVVLGWEHIRPDGSMEAFSRFNFVEFKPQLDRLFEPPPGVPAVQTASRPVSLHDLTETLGYAPQFPRWLPPGYKQESSFLTTCEDGCGAPAGMTRFSDGVNSIVLFQSRRVIGGVDSRPNEHVVSLVKDNVNYIVVGDADPQLLKQIGRSVPAPPPSPEPQPDRSLLGSGGH